MIRAGYRCGVQRRIHVAGVERKESHTFRCVLFVPNPTQVMQRGLTRAVRSPTRISIYRGVARDVEHNSAASFASGRRQCSHQCLCQTERAKDIGSKRALEIFAFSIRQHRQRCWSKVRSVIDQHIKAAELACYLDRHWINITLGSDITYDSVHAGILADDLLDPFARACNESDTRTSLR